MNSKSVLAGLLFVIFSILLLGTFYLFTSPLDTVNYAFSYVAGLTMIVLPCTFPLVFIIVPLSMGKRPMKGLGMALLFGLGLSITIMLYAVAVAALGNALGLDEVIGGAGLVSRVLFVVGGLAAFAFGLDEVGLVNFSAPTFGGATPKFIEEQKDYLKAFFIGLFLGNAGVGCPNPLFYILLGDIAVLGNIANGALLGLVHGIGRATPLIFLSILAILGINATNTLVKNREKVQKLIGWGLVFLGAVIIMLGAAHQWWEESFVHKGWNEIVNATGLPSELEMGEHEHEGEMNDFIPEAYAPWVLLILLAGPVAWHYLKR